MPKITLKAARVNCGLTQTEAARMIGVSIGTLKNWECGKTFPKQPQIEAMCNIYGITYDALFFA